MTLPNGGPVTQTPTYRASRPQVVGAETPQGPFPIYLSGAVQKGFGRGGKDLGCPTANLPDDALPQMVDVTPPGVYFGYAQISARTSDAQVDGPSSGTLDEEQIKVHPMVMSLGWNPFYKNKKLTAEIHIMHPFNADFYGHEMRAIVLGYIRPELDYTSREDLIEDIETDKRVALKSLVRPDYQKFAHDKHFDLALVHEIRP
ncbi:riboflavin kinase [Thelephora ganbajun]|uniref:Riboflavin kinase n=1 Tax=Thelephora ganbajun TaxID=370292 RepID=A0ACB6ZQH8_THEGA|nr:riboflavin kinase [Thelephora ganbajun]